MICLPALVMILAGWGRYGHEKISYNIILFMNNEMSQLSDWPTLLAGHSSDADDRKATDPTEAPKHYIDIDNYIEFITYGRIPQTKDSVLSIHGYSFVLNNGILPWATETAYDSLRSCFARYDWTRAMLFASDLGHYVGDGHNPLHITRYYDGRTESQYGIHSRYESSMVNEHLDEIVYPGGPIAIIPDINRYIFNYLYANYVYVDSIFAADDYAQSISSNPYSSLYKNALWQKTGGFTINLFRNASRSLTEMIYTAWVQAGRPLISETSVTSFISSPGFYLGQNYPNPVSLHTSFSYSIGSDADVVICVRDFAGKIVKILVNQRKHRGTYSFTYHPAGLEDGIYFITLESGRIFQARRMIVSIE